MANAPHPVATEIRALLAARDPDPAAIDALIAEYVLQWPRERATETSTTSAG